MKPTSRLVRHHPAAQSQMRAPIRILPRGDRALVGRTQIIWERQRPGIVGTGGSIPKNRTNRGRTWWIRKKEKGTGGGLGISKHRTDRKCKKPLIQQNWTLPLGEKVHSLLNKVPCEHRNAQENDATTSSKDSHLRYHFNLRREPQHSKIIMKFEIVWNILFCVQNMAAQESWYGWWGTGVDQIVCEYISLGCFPRRIANGSGLPCYLEYKAITVLTIKDLPFKCHQVKLKSSNPNLKCKTVLLLDVTLESDNQSTRIWIHI